jgi:hypothetical protein
LKEVRVFTEGFILCSQKKGTSKNMILFMLRLMRDAYVLLGLLGNID